VSPKANSFHVSQGKKLDQCTEDVNLNVLIKTRPLYDVWLPRYEFSWGLNLSNTNTNIMNILFRTKLGETYETSFPDDKTN
jgi:hypothetical protein